MTLYKWSQTAASDANADPTINWAEGQAPSSVNDSARAMMAATAKYRDDIAGAILTGGTSIAYTVSSFQVFDTLAHLNGQTIAFTPHVTNGATVTLNVDSLGAKPLRSAPNTELLPGTIIQGTPYVAVYNNADGAFYLRGFYGNAYNVPLGAGMDFWGSTAPNSSFAFPFGQAISRTTYASLFALVGTTYGTGDGSTTFNLPDVRGRVVAAIDNMGGTAANRLTNITNPTALGGNGGEQAHTLATGEIPAHQHNVFLKDPGHFHGYIAHDGGANQGGGSPGGSDVNNNTSASTTGITIGSVSGVANDNLTASIGGSGSHNNVQPTIVCNYIIRII